MPQAPSTNMGIILPTDHGDDDVWDAILDTALGIVVDRHDHTTGKGIKIPSSALNINADVSWSAGGTPRAITDLKAIDFTPTAAAGMTALAGALFVDVDGELYWRTTSGSNVQLTAGAALNIAAFAGGIGGDYSAAGALVSYDDATDSYLFQQQGAPRPWARMRSGDVDIYETAPSIVNRVRLQSPAALAASYALTLPTALPASTQLLQISAAGVMSISNTLGVSLTLSADLTLGAEIKHAQRVMVVGGAAFTPGNNFATSAISYSISTNTWVMGVAPNDNLGANVPLRSGDRILSLVWHFDKGGSASLMTFALLTRNGSTVVTRDTANDGGTSGVGFTSIARFTVNYTIAANDAVWLSVASSNAAHRFSHCIVAWDRP